MNPTEEIAQLRTQIEAGGKPKYHEKNAAQGKLFVRARIEALCDAGSFVEDAFFANCKAADLPSDGVVTGLGQIEGRTVAILANDSTVKAGSWGARTVEKMLRIQETAKKLLCPIFYLIDSAGARITDQVEMFPGRRGAGLIFKYQVEMSGLIPQICLLFGPSAAGGAYIPAFCDVVVMVDQNASMYLGSPRMAEMVIGEKVTLEEMGGARMHCSESGCGDVLVKSEQEALEWGRKYLSFMPQNALQIPKQGTSRTAPESDIEALLPDHPNKPCDVKKFLRALLDDESFLEIKAKFAQELVTGFGRLDGYPIGVLANQSKFKGGVLFADSADKAARFIELCDAFNIPLLYLADVPGFMIGSKVERQGIIRHGAKMISAVSEASVPKISVILRKAYGAGLYAMGGPAFAPDCTIALPGSMIAVMGPEAAVNAVYANKIAELPEEEREAFVLARRAEYAADVDVLKLASELVIDDIVSAKDLRQALIARFHYYRSGYLAPGAKKHSVHPV